MYDKGLFVLKATVIKALISILWLTICGGLCFIPITVVLILASGSHNINELIFLGIWVFVSMGLFFCTWAQILSVIYGKITEKILNLSYEQLFGLPSPQYYAQAEDELNGGTIDNGLWSKALVKAKGNENVRKAVYIKMRAKQLHKEG